MTTRFDTSLKFLLSLEGGFTIDNGGPTNYGIRQVTYDAYLEAHNLTATPVEKINPFQVANIYRESYWTPCACNDLPAGLDLAVFDAAVQHGPEQAIKLLQRVLRVDVDGDIGPLTIAAAKGAHPAILSAELLLSRVKRIYTKHERWDEYGKGWTIRLARLNMEVLRQSL